MFSILLRCYSIYEQVKKSTAKLHAFFTLMLEYKLYMLLIEDHEMQNSNNSVVSYFNLYIHVTCKCKIR